MVFGERRLVVLREGDAGFRDVGEEFGFRGARRRSRLRREMRGDVGDVVGGKLRRDRVHDRVLAAAVLQRRELQLEVTRLLPSEIRNSVADAHALRAVAGRANSGGLRLAGLDVGRDRGGRAGYEHCQSRNELHFRPPVNCRCVRHGRAKCYCGGRTPSLLT